MRIGVPTTSYPHASNTVAGAFVRELCVGLAARGHTLEVLAPAEGLVADPGIDVVSIAHRGPVLGTHRALRSPFDGAGAPDELRQSRAAWWGAAAFVAALTRAIRRRAPTWDAVLSQWALPCAVATGLAHGPRGHVAVWHSADVHLAHRLGIARLVEPSAAHHVFVAEHLRDTLAFRAASVVPMGIRTPPHVAPRAPISGRLHAVVLARLVPIKRVELAIDAVAKVAGVELTIAGEGPDRARLEALAARVAPARIRFVGVVSGDAKGALLARADVLLATSGRGDDGSREGYPVAPREALAHGALVVATDDPVHRELRRRTGPAVRLVSEADLADELRRLRDDVPLRVALGASAAASVRDDSLERVAARFEDLLLHARR